MTTMMNMMNMMNMMKNTGAALCLLVTALPCGAEPFFLNKGDKVVMMGDSITEQHMYSSYVEAWALTRFPAWDIRFVNVGIGGDGAPGGNNRFKRDVLPYAPTAMTVNFGMNDCGGPGSTFDEGRFKDFTNCLQGIASQAKAAKIRVAWCTTPLRLRSWMKGHRSCPISKTSKNSRQEYSRLQQPTATHCLSTSFTRSLRRLTKPAQ